MPFIPINPTAASAGSPDRGGPRRTTARARTALPSGSPPVRAVRPRHAINARQKKMYWNAWRDARAVLIRSGQYSPREADCYRHELHMQALGEAVSSNDLTNRQLDLVLAAFAAVARPDDLGAQMAGETGTRRRTLHALKAMAGGREEYIAAICGDCFGHANWQRLSDSDLHKLRMTMERRLRRNDETRKPKSEESGEAAS